MPSAVALGHPPHFFLGLGAANGDQTIHTPRSESLGSREAHREDRGIGQRCRGFEGPIEVLIETDNCWVVRAIA